MPMSGPARRRGREDGEATRRRIVDAALETLRSDGFAGASARAIADRGGFNQALIFYHFGTVNDLLLAALDETSRRRLDHYEQAVAQASTLPELLETARRLYQEDVAAGHITVINELIGGSITYPALRGEIAARVESWVAFAESVIVTAIEGTPLAQLVSSRDAARATVALYLGTQLLTQLDGEAAVAESLFATGERLAGLFDQADALTTEVVDR